MTGKILIKDLNSQNKPRERLIEKGASALSDIELLAILLRSGGKSFSVTDLASKLLAKFKNIKGVLEADLNSLNKQKYIGISKSTTIKAASELGKRAYLAKNNFSNNVVKKPEDAYKIIKKDLYGKKQEHLYLISLDSRKKLVSKDLICIGSINETLVPVREIIKKAILNNAVNIILAHNHPSNDSTPSHEDLIVTEKTAQACKLCGIHLLDHLIVCDDSYTSIKGLNLFNERR